MCTVRALDKKTRTIYSIGNVFLIIGISMTILLHGYRAEHRVLFDTVRGACLLLAIVAMFWVLRQRRRGCAARRPGA